MSGPLLAKVKRFYAATRDLVDDHTLERFHDGSVSRLQGLVHLSVMAVQSFLRNRCPVRATALSYTTLLALVPLLAVGVGVTTSFLQERGQEASRQLIDKLVQAAAPQLDLVSSVSEEAEPVPAREQVVAQIEAYIGKFHSKTVGLSGLVAMIVFSILLLSTIEKAFNDIWGVTRGRAWFQRLVTYWTTISLGPVLIVMAFVFAQGTDFAQNLPLVSRVGEKVLSFFIISVSFALLYKLMPNTCVQWRAALWAGGVAGCLWLLLSTFSAVSLGRVAQLRNVYGSLAIIPIFLIGLYFSWLLVLFGAQISYTIQNRKVYLQDRRAIAVSQTGREYLALRVMTLVAQRFSSSSERPSNTELSERLGVSSRLVSLVLEPLLDAGLVAQLADAEDATYIPGRPIETITFHDVLVALRSGADPTVEGDENPEGQLVLDAFNRIQDSEKQTASAMNFREMIQTLTADPARHPSRRDKTG